METFYMITINKENKLFANVYEDKDKFLEASKNISQKYPIRLWELTTTTSNNFDLVIAKVKDQLLACLEPKTEITGENLFRCVKKEIKV